MQAAAMGGAATMPVRGSGRKAKGAQCTNKGAKEAKNTGKGTRKGDKQLHKSLGNARMDHCVANLL